MVRASSARTILATAFREKGELGAPVAGGDDVFQILQPAVRGELVVQGERGAHDGVEDIVDVVGHAAGQPTDGLHALALLQLRLHVPSVGDVLQLADPTGGVVRLLNGRQGDFDDDETLVLVPRVDRLLVGFSGIGL